MPFRFSGRQSEEVIAHVGRTVRYEREFPLKLRVFLLPWAFLCIPFVLLFLRNLQDADHGPVSLAGLVFQILFLLALPLGLSGCALWYAVAGKEVILALDPDAGFATLKLCSMFTAEERHYPLPDIRVETVELQAGAPAVEAPNVTVRMPDRRTVRMTCFFRDADAQFWARQIRQAIASAEN